MIQLGRVCVSGDANYLYPARWGWIKYKENLELDTYKSLSSLDNRRFGSGKKGNSKKKKNSGVWGVCAYNFHIQFFLQANTPNQH